MIAGKTDSIQRATVVDTVGRYQIGQDAKRHIGSHLALEQYACALSERMKFGEVQIYIF